MDPLKASMDCDMTLPKWVSDKWTMKFASCDQYF